MEQRTVITNFKQKVEGLKPLLTHGIECEPNRKSSLGPRYTAMIKNNGVIICDNDVYMFMPYEDLSDDFINKLSKALDDGLFNISSTMIDDDINHFMTFTNHIYMESEESFSVVLLESDHDVSKSRHRAECYFNGEDALWDFIFEKEPAFNEYGFNVTNVIIYNAHNGEQVFEGPYNDMVEFVLNRY